MYSIITILLTIIAGILIGCSTATIRDYKKTPLSRLLIEILKLVIGIILAILAFVVFYETP